MEPQANGADAASDADGRAAGLARPDRLTVRIGDLGVVLVTEPDRPDRPDQLEQPADPAQPDALAALRRRLDELERHRGPDVTRRLALAAAVEDRARAIGAETEQMRARLVQADMSHASGEVEVGTRLALEVNRWASSGRAPAVLARSHLVLSTMLEWAGDGAGALDHAVRAVELLPADATERTRGNHLFRLGDALTAVSNYDAARHHYREAEQIFVGIGDLERRMAVLNNLADTELSAGHLDTGWEVAREMLALAGGPGGLTHPADFDTIATAMLGVGRAEEAERLARAGLERLADGSPGGAGTQAELQLTLAQALRTGGDPGGAQLSLDLCLRLCRERGLEALRVQALGEQAELHAATGRFELAYSTHRAFYAETMRLTARQRESAAHARQALYETTEARRQAARFWDQARSDPLTGLRNRRFVDEELPRLLDRFRVGGPSVLAAIVDADHFKRVNDTFSHQTGDLVIRTLATLFSSTVDDWRAAGHPSPGFVARLGGEEFLLVLLGEVRPAVAVLERMRRSVHGHGWHPIVGALPVSVSVGAALAGPGDTQHSLLGRADRNLYLAKSGGRNRVVCDPFGPGPSLDPAF